MKVLHITNEFSKKNFSISSLIFFISKRLKDKFNFEASILTSFVDYSLFSKKDNLNTIKEKSWLFFFSIKNQIEKIIKKHETIHVHGLWAPIQLISILVCIRLKSNLIIHPHGMLLEEAVKGAGIIKYFLKIFTLFFLKNIIRDNVYFVAITSQEIAAIKKYFPIASVKNIANPVPFNFKKLPQTGKEKTIVYFGRIHPHKNIDLMIDSFLEANLNREWKLEIYGIRDDENYFLKLQKKIEHIDQIKIYNPIFEDEKRKKMSSAWLNILISKSEVLSLSILESSQYGLPTLVNSKIEITDNNNETIPTVLNKTEIANKLKEITSWQLEERVLKETKVKNFLQNKISIEKIEKNYYTLYEEIHKIPLEKIEQYKKEKLFYSFSELEKIFNFLFISGSYAFNLMFSSLLVVSLVGFGFFEVAGELGLMVSFWLTTTQIFSSNMKGIIIAENNKILAKETLFYRFNFSLVVLIIFYLILYNIFNFHYNSLIFLISSLILVQWITEMKLVQYELDDKQKIFRFILVANFLFVVFSILIIAFGIIKNMESLIIYYILFLSMFWLKDVFNQLLILKNIAFQSIVNTNIKTIAFISSFSIIVSSFIWRLAIFYIFDKGIAGIFFACFSIGSFPGTFFNSVVGPTYIKQNIILPNKIKFIFVIILLILIYIFLHSSYEILIINNLQYTSYLFIIFTISISLIGAYLMSCAMYFRHKELQKDIIQRQKLFKIDVIYGLLISSYIPLLYSLGGAVGVSFTYFLASVSAYYFYYRNYRIENN